MIDPDLDPDCKWDGPKGERSIRHIVECPVCATIWPQIAEDPEGAIRLKRLKDMGF